MNGVGPWREYEVRDTPSVTIGPLTLHLAEVAGEIRVAYEREGIDDEARWTRWAPRKWTGRVELRPAFPDRLLVVSPEDDFNLVSGADARIYVRVPLWVEVVAVAEDGTDVLTGLPTVPASDTWWGTVEEGELGYWLETHARRSVSDDLFQPYLAMCPLHLVNHSADDLTVHKIAVRVEFLSLFSENERIWADTTRVRYQGDEEGSRLEMVGRAPDDAPEARLLAPPRRKMGRGFTARTFARLRSIHEWVS